MQRKCEFCGKEVDEEESNFRLELGEETYNFCTLSCLHNSKPIGEIKHRNLSSLILNKTVFEFFAILTGIGGVYYTLFEAANNALMMDTISVVAAIIAMIIGIEHIRYVEEHEILKKGVILIGITILSTILLIVWHNAFR